MGLNSNKQTHSTSIHEEDIVVFMDAYDVLLFPSIRNIAKHFHLSSTPIVFCTEHGLYPEFSSNGRYTRDSFYQRDYTNGGRFSNNSNSNSNSMVDYEALVEEYIREHYTRDVLDAKQLNSGCYLGRAKQVRCVFIYTYTDIHTLTTVYLP